MHFPCLGHFGLCPRRKLVPGHRDQSAERCVHSFWKVGRLVIGKKRYVLCFKASWQWPGNILHFFTKQLHMLTKLKLPHSRQHDEHDGLLHDHQHLRPRLLQLVFVAKERRALFQRGQSHDRKVIHSTQIPGWPLYQILLPGLPVKQIVLTLNWWRGLLPPLTTRRERFSPTLESYTVDSTH